MRISQQQREFWSQKHPAQEYDTVVFNHSEFSKPVRLVLNQFESFIFNGNLYLPVAAKLTLPDQGSDLTPKLNIQFSRAHIGDEFKKIINSITPFGWQEPISMVYEQFNDLSLDEPTQRYILYVTEDGIRFNRSSVQLSAGDDNPMILGKPRNCSSNPVYTIEEYKGLSNL